MRIYVAGHTGMVGSAICRAIVAQLPSSEIIVKTRAALDLLDQRAVFEFLRKEKPDYIFVAAAKVGGIHANSTLRGQFLYENLTIETNLIHGAYQAGITNALFLGSSCIYPRDCPQPIKEDYLLTGRLEQTNEPYAIAKIAGVKLCECYNQQYGTNFICLMPTNLYGPADNYDIETCHVLPALIRKTHEAKRKGTQKLVVWGSGKPYRDFLHVDDLAAACIFFMQRSLEIFGSKRRVMPILNIGSGCDHTISDLANLVMKTLQFEGVLEFDRSKPDGTPRKLLDVSRARAMGWKPTIELAAGIKNAYADFIFRFGDI